MNRLTLLLLQLLIVCVAVASGWSACACLLGISDGLVQVMTRRFGPVAVNRLHDWQRSEQLIQGAGLSETALLERVNSLVNRIPYGDDRTVWGVEEYWATPAEFVAVHAGDCDDYVIAKYLTLRSHGIPAAKLRLVYVRAVLQGRLGTHMVLAYYPTPSAEPLVLDNIRQKVSPVSQRPDLVPVYSFNDEHFYREGPSESRLIAGGVSMVRRWSDLQERIKREKEL